MPPQVCAQLPPQLPEPHRPGVSCSDSFWGVGSATPSASAFLGKAGFGPTHRTPVWNLALGATVATTDPQAPPGVTLRVSWRPTRRAPPLPSCLHTCQPRGPLWHGALPWVGSHSPRSPLQACRLSGGAGLPLPWSPVLLTPTQALLAGLEAKRPFHNRHGPASPSGMTTWGLPSSAALPICPESPQAGLSKKMPIRSPLCPQPWGQHSPGVWKVAQELPEGLAHAEGSLEPRAILQLHGDADLGRGRGPGRWGGLLPCPQLPTGRWHVPWCPLLMPRHHEHVRQRHLGRRLECQVQVPALPWLLFPANRKADGR